VNLTTGFVIDDKTDLSVSYFLYRSDNYTDNSSDSVPYGMEATEHSVTVGVTRRLSEKMRVNLRYGFSDYEDTTSGGNNDFQAHFLFSSLQYRF
jgi:hypothetical protein